MDIYQEAVIRQQIGLTEEALLVIEDAFVKLAQNQVVMPPVMHIDISDYQGEVDVKSAYIKGLDKFVIKQSSGFFNNPKKGLPSSGGLMIVIDATTGFPCALLLDNGYLTDIRTALAGAISAKYLAPKKINKVGVIGAGNQAKLQLEALKLVRDYNEVIVHARDLQKAEAFAKTVSKQLDCKISVARLVSQVVTNVDTLITTTPSSIPFVMIDDLHPGLHITAMGSDAPYKNEVDALAFDRFDQIVCDDINQCLKLGECHFADKNGFYQKNEHKVTTLGKIINTPKLARQGDEVITLCDLTGVGAQDTAIANYALKRLQKTSKVEASELGFSHLL
ncbi:cyclodeaminase [Facilibium subflavum]|uniref:cyclodeaminase n=1 Tax=Facilibium subflavum TaxID=2219058 RepID=UPI000E64E70F|nr:cyclodeaminase [Facilibium subflavum]